MLDILGFLLDSVNAFFNLTWQFLSDGLYNFTVWAFTHLIEMVEIAILNFTIWAIPFAWDVAKNLITDLGLSSLISSAWMNVNPTVMGFLRACRVPDCVNLLISALFTKYVLRYILFV